jgi:hypothetical protein
MDDFQLSPNPATVTAPAPGPPPAAASRARGWRLSAGIAALGVVTVVPIYAWIAVLQSRGNSVAALAMPTMGMSRMGVFWAFPVLQAGGLAALLWAYLGVALGLAESGRTMRWLPLRRRDLHRTEHPVKRPAGRRPHDPRHDHGNLFYRGTFVRAERTKVPR